MAGCPLGSGKPILPCRFGSYQFILSYIEIRTPEFKMPVPTKIKTSLKNMPTEKGPAIRMQEASAKKKQYINRRVITEISEKGVSEEIKKGHKRLRVPFKSISPKTKKHQQAHKQSTAHLTKASRMKSPKPKGATETGPHIKKNARRDKRPLNSHHPEYKKNKYEARQVKSPARKKKQQRLKKVNVLPKNQRLKTQGSFDSTISCVLNKDVEIIGVIGEGTFGRVFKGRMRDSGRAVAIKRVLQDRKYNNRELEIIGLLDSDFVMKVLGTYITHERENEYLNILMALYDTDLYGFIQEHSEESVSAFDFKLITYQIFRGLLYVHSKGICHRDIKPHNILLKGRNAVLCDFGSAKVIRKGEANLPYICSRCYRAPELIFGSNQYSTMIDIWSAGCVILEMINRLPLFIGESSIDHLIEVIKVMGTPTKTQVIDMNPDYDLNDYKFPKVKKRQWQKVFPKADPLLVDLLGKIMRYSPKQRLTAAEALAHEFYDELRDERVFHRIRKATGISRFFDFTGAQLEGNERLHSKLVPPWY